MIGLLDVNVLVALFDSHHIHHSVAHGWFGSHRSMGWATCPITENGLVRIVSNPTYPGATTTFVDAVDRLRRFCTSGDHVFWPDSLSIRDPDRWVDRHVRGHRQLTDVYLLALAVDRGGRLVTFDGSLERRAVSGARPESLIRPPAEP